MSEMTECLLKLLLTPGLGPVTIWKLLRRFGSAENVLAASDSALSSVEGIAASRIELVRRARSVDPRPEIDRAVSRDVQILPYDDPGYPEILRHMFDPPILLYVRGDLRREDQVAVGVVGTRHVTNYGREQSGRFAFALAKAGYTVVSGMALGVDSFAHMGALDARGRTIAVMGCGFDHIYPEQNRDLAMEISRRGAVVTEFSMQIAPSRETFPVRNRIIAGLSLGVLVVEAPTRSGALITARHANEMGRPVFVVPGRAGDAASEGSNGLIRDGAKLVTGLNDIISELPLDRPPSPPAFERKPSVRNTPGDSTKRLRKIKGDIEKRSEAQPVNSGDGSAPVADGDEERILNALTGEWRPVDEVTAMTGLPAGKTISLLSMLRMKRKAEQRPGQLWRLRQRREG